jgi:lipid II:glycine glycyltransferase (peptidoglycan interpeptide bridge formation enzyme)
MENELKNNEFLQSKAWSKFQEAFGRNTFFLAEENFSACLIEHILPVVGKYFYGPRGPLFSVETEKTIFNDQFPISNEFSNHNDQIKKGIQKVIELANSNNASWVRIEPENEEMLEIIKKNLQELGLEIRKAPYDVQPKEIFKIDISKNEEQLLSEMKPKTRYNINLARKKGVEILSCGKNSLSCMPIEMDFLKLTREMAKRQGIVAHPQEYYKKMIQTLPSEMLKIYAAQYEGKIIATNLVLFFGDTATYLHGASGNENRNVMAPFLLHWQAILDAKEKGMKYYDFGGVKIQDTRYKIQDTNPWEGITNFKLGFSVVAEAKIFPGTYDIIINSRAYGLYKGLQRAKKMLGKFRK